MFELIPISGEKRKDSQTFASGRENMAQCSFFFPSPAGKFRKQPEAAGNY